MRMTLLLVPITMFAMLAMAGGSLAQYLDAGESRDLAEKWKRLALEQKGTIEQQSRMIGEQSAALKRLMAASDDLMAADARLKAAAQAAGCFPANGSTAP